MVTLEVCVGTACSVKGSYNVISSLQELAADHDLDGKLKIERAFCHGNCKNPVAVKFAGEEEVFTLSAKNTKEFFEEEVMKRIKAC